MHTVGCDVCGPLLDAEKAATQAAWHRAEEERLDHLTQGWARWSIWFATVEAERQAAR
jgi:hypothetical protein